MGARDRPFLVGRGVYMNEQVREKVDGSDEVGKDLTTDAGRWVVLFRAYKGPADASYEKEVALDASTGTDGFVAGYIPAFTTKIPRLICELVLKDTTIADAGTPSTKAERVLARWATSVVDSAT